MKTSTVAAALGAAVSLVVGGCGAATSTPSSKVATANISIAGAPDPQYAAEFLLAQDLGYFKQEHLNVTDNLFASGGAALSAMAAGDDQFGVMGDVVWETLLAAGAKIDLLSQDSLENNATWLVVNKSIQTPSQLAGKKIGVVPSSPLALFLAVVAEDYHVPLSSIKVIDDTSQEGNAAALISGTIDGAVFVGPTGPQAVSGGRAVGAHLLMTANYTYFNGVKRYHSIYRNESVIVGNAAYIKAHPGVAARFMKAIVMAANYINNHSQAAATLEARDNPTFTKQEILAQWAAVHYQPLLDSAFVNALQRDVDLAYGAHFWKTKPSIRSFIYTKALSTADPSAVTYKG